MQWKLGKINYIAMEIRIFFYNENHGNKNYIAMEIRKKNVLQWKSGKRFAMKIRGRKYPLWWKSGKMTCPRDIKDLKFLLEWKSGRQPFAFPKICAAQFILKSSRLKEYGVYWLRRRKKNIFLRVPDYKKNRLLIKKKKELFSKFQIEKR